MLQESTGDMKILDSGANINVNGSISSTIFIHPRASVKDASLALRQDIIRSFAARLELHLDSLVSETDTTPEGKQRSILSHESKRDRVNFI